MVQVNSFAKILILGFDIIRLSKMISNSIHKEVFEKYNASYIQRTTSFEYESVVIKGHIHPSKTHFKEDRPYDYKVFIKTPGLISTRILMSPCKKSCNNV